MTVSNHPDDNQPLAPILDAAGQRVLQIFNEQHDTALVYHNYQRTLGVVAHVRDLGEGHGVDEKELETALLAGWFHATGYLVDYRAGIGASAQLAQSFLEMQEYPAEQSAKVIATILSLREERKPEFILDQLLSDAVYAQDALGDFLSDRMLLRLEQELIDGQKLSNYDWHRLQLQYLLGIQFFLPTTKGQYEKELAQNILAQKQKVAKAKPNDMLIAEPQDGLLRKFQSLERRQPTSGTQTFFRTNYRNHINLSAIADNKANIMISVNAILISVIISALSYQNVPENNPAILLPAVIFLVTALGSLILAVLSIRPKITNNNEEVKSLEEAQKNIVFFGNFVRLDLDQFESAVDQVLRDGELLYGNMTRDLYFLGKVLEKKYYYLTLAYNVFMLGFIVTVVTFLGVLLF